MNAWMGTWSGLCLASSVPSILESGGCKGLLGSIIRDGFQRFYLPKDLDPSSYSIFPSCDQRSFPFALYAAGATVTPKRELPRGQEAV